MRLRPLHPDLGVEVIGFDVQSGGSAGEIAELRALYDEHGMLLFRGGGRISPERHEEIISWFGPPGPISNNEDGDIVTVLDNEVAAGSFRLPFHSDNTYTEVPMRGLCLHPIALPEGGSSTSFVSSVAAWRRLSPAMQEKLAGLTLRHVLVIDMPEFDWPDFAADHPARLIHPRTGEPLLCVTEYHADRFLELGEEESRALLEELFAHLYAPERVYDHPWQLHDVLVWDNLMIQHSRKAIADPSLGRRVIQRCALGEMGMPELLRRRRAQLAAA